MCIYTSLSIEVCLHICLYRHTIVLIQKTKYITISLRKLKVRNWDDGVLAVNKQFIFGEALQNTGKNPT